MDVKTYIPHFAIQDYVLNISTVHAVLPTGMDIVVTPYPPTPFQSLMFYCNNPVSMAKIDLESFNMQPLATLVGPQFSRVNIKVHNQLHAIRIDFLPGGLYRMLGLPMLELFDCGFDASLFFGDEIAKINEQLQEINDLEAGKNIVESFLLKQVKNVKELLPIDLALRMLLQQNGNMSMDKIASLSCLSLKTFERKCKERIGMNPKSYARILKFSKAYRIHEAFPQLSWTNIAYEAGYYDQMHMIKDFKVFAGVNPSVIEQQLLATPLRMQKDLRY